METFQKKQKVNLYIVKDKQIQKEGEIIMKKSTFVAMILGTIGGILFALGMCVALIPEWNAFKQGVVMGVIGAVVLLIMVLVWRKMENKNPIKVSAKTIGTVLWGDYRSPCPWSRNVPDNGVEPYDDRHCSRHCGNRPASEPDPDDKRAEINSGLKIE